MVLRKAFKDICKSPEQGLSFMELLVGMGLITTILSAALSVFLSTTSISIDNETVLQAEEKARTLLDIMVFDLRMAGSGMPLGQDNFAPGGSGLGDAPLAVLLSSDDEYIKFRINETGESAVLTSSYTPSAVSLTFNVTSVSDFAAGDIVYLTNFTSLGEEGLKGTVDSLTPTSITIDSSYTASSGAVFGTGSVAFRVSEVEYDSPTDWSGITRDNGTGSLVLASNSKFSLDYLDESGNSITLPLSNSEVENDLTMIHVTVTVQSTKKLHRTGQIYSAVAEQTVTLRNLVQSRQN